jgi:site-specific recombinase XerD
MAANDVTVSVWVRHDADCTRKDEGPGFKGCRCWKQLYEHRSRRRYAANTRSWTKAEEKARAKEKELRGDEPAPVEGLTIRDAVNAYVAYERGRNLSKAQTGKINRWIGKRLLDYCDREGLSRLHQITREHFSNFRSEWKVGPGTKNKVRMYFSTFFRYCIESDWCKHNPAKQVKKVKEPPPEVKFFDDAQYELLLMASKSYADGVVNSDAWRARLHAMLRLLRWSGLRISDAVTLDSSHLKGNRIVKRMIKTGHWVNVLIPPDVAAEVRALGGPRYFGDFVGDLETVTKDWWDRISKLAGKCGVKATPKMFRHTFAVRFLEAHGRIEDLQKALGHKSLATTQRYYAQWSQGQQDNLDHALEQQWAKQGLKQPSVVQ